MAPCAAIADVPDRIHGDAELTRQDGIIFRSMSDASDNFIGQLGQTLVFAPGGAFWLGVLAIALPTCGSFWHRVAPMSGTFCAVGSASFVIAILLIVAVCPEAEVGRVAAWRIVAGVHHHLASFDYIDIVIQPKRPIRREPIFAIEAELSVAVDVAGADPRPAFIGTKDLNSGPEVGYGVPFWHRML